MERSTRAVVDFGNLACNLSTLRSKVNPFVKTLGVVKANAYGHGLVETARFLEDNGIDYLGVAIPQEGILLRNAGIMTPILILGVCSEEELADVVTFDLTASVSTVEMLLALNDASVRENKVAKIHFKIDTGMNRIGFKNMDSFACALRVLKELPNIAFEGMFTHYATSESDNDAFFKNQLAQFREYVQMAQSCGYSPLCHASNSGAIIYHSEYPFDMVRCGISLYGYNPRGYDCTDIPLKPVMRWETRISHLKEVGSEESIGYGRTYFTKRKSLIATLPVGYGDGLMRCLSGKEDVLIHGKRVPLVGTICMDQVMCDVTELSDVKIGDPVILLGNQGDETITADEMARNANTISYEILLNISSRVPRIYINS